MIDGAWALAAARTFYPDFCPKVATELGTALQLSGFTNSNLTLSEYLSGNAESFQILTKAIFFQYPRGQ